MIDNWRPNIILYQCMMTGEVYYITAQPSSAASDPDNITDECIPHICTLLICVNSVHKQSTFIYHIHLSSIHPSIYYSNKSVHHSSPHRHEYKLSYST